MRSDYPLNQLGGTGRQNSASKWSLACSWLPQIFRPRRKASLLLEPTVQSCLEGSATHTSITTVATSSSYSVSHPVLTTSNKTSPLYNSKNKLNQLQHSLFLSLLMILSSCLLHLKSQHDFSWAHSMQKKAKAGYWGGGVKGKSNNFPSASCIIAEHHVFKKKIRTTLALALVIYTAKRSQPTLPQLQDTSPTALMSLDNKACNFASNTSWMFLWSSKLA